ncbi:MAG: glycerate kinase [Opitutae bacterium]
MHILAAFDKCKDSLSAREICALGQKVASAKPFNHDVHSIPLTDGGEGFTELLTHAKKGTYHSILANDSLGEEKEVKVGIVPSGKLDLSLREFTDLPSQGNWAVVEMSSIAGLSDLPQEKRNPWLTSTIGVGQLLAGVSSLGVSAIILGIGGSSTNDMGLGALSALGVNFFDRDGKLISFPVPECWSRIAKISAEKLITLPPIRIACDVSNQLLGENGATFQFGPQKGLSANRKEKMESNMELMSERLSQIFQKPLNFRNQEGTGAAGGIAYGLSLAFETQFVPGFSFVSKWFNLENEIKKTDLILTGEGRFDQTSLYGKGPYEIIRLASKYQKKVVLLAGSVEKKAVEKCMREFANVEIVAFGSSQLSLEQNLTKAPELFEIKLKSQLSYYQ